MKPPAPAHFIDVDALRVGMQVHLDGGWMSHPFALSTFRIASTEQIETLRRLGLRRVRWSPPAADAAVTAPLGPAAERPTPMPGATAAAAASIAPDAIRDERLALDHCRRRFRAAGLACRQALDALALAPEQARVQTEALAATLLETLLGTEDLCVRLMLDGGSDRPAGHALNVMVLSMLMGRSFGLPEAELIDLGVGAMLHDIGKADLPLRVRHRRDDFSTAEHRDHEEHVAHGLAHARRMGLSPGATLVVAQHHELADGSGYPLRLKAERMTTAARIAAIVDRYDDLCHPPSPSRRLTPHESVSSLFAQGKDTYETSLLNGFIRMMGVYPPGSTVQLTDDRHAMVMSVHSSRPLKPRVLVHEPGTPREHAVPLDLERTEGLGIRRSIRPSQLPPAALAYLAPQERMAYFFGPAREVETA